MYSRARCARRSSVEADHRCDRDAAVQDSRVCGASVDAASGRRAKGVLERHPDWWKNVISAKIIARRSSTRTFISTRYDPSHYLRPKAPLLCSCILECYKEPHVGVRRGMRTVSQAEKNGVSTARPQVTEQTRNFHWKSGMRSPRRA